MLLAKVFERSVEKTPVSVMARTAMEHALAPEALDVLFEEHTDKQYTRALLFSSVVDLMGGVVGKVAPSVHAAYQAVAETLPVSIASVYNQKGRLSPWGCSSSPTPDPAFRRSSPVSGLGIGDRRWASYAPDLEGLAKGPVTAP